MEEMSTQEVVPQTIPETQDYHGEPQENPEAEDHGPARDWKELSEITYPPAAPIQEHGPTPIEEHGPTQEYRPKVWVSTDQVRLQWVRRNRKSLQVKA